MNAPAFIAECSTLAPHWEMAGQVVIILAFLAFIAYMIGRN